MNDPNLPGLDERAEAAAADLRARAASRPRPAFDASAPAPPAVRGPDRARRVLAVAAALLLVVGAVGWWASSRDDGSTDPAQVVTTDPRPFVLGEIPDGFQLIGAGEVTDAALGEVAANAPGPLAVYGPDADHPELGVATFPSFDEDTAERGRTDLEVAGHRVYEADGVGMGRRVVFAEVDGASVVALSPTLSRAQLVSVLDSVEVRGDRATVALGGLPDGWDDTGAEVDMLGLGSTATAPGSSVGAGHYVAYQRGGWSTSEGTAVSPGEPEPATTTTEAPADTLDDAALLYVASGSGDESALVLARLTADEATPTEVRGHPALLTKTMVGSSPVGSTLALSWFEAPGQLIRVSASGRVSEAQLRSAAESLTALDDEAWQDLVDRSALGELDPANSGEVTKVAEGRFDGGSRWVLGVVPVEGGEGSVSLRFSVASVSNASSSFSTQTGATDEAEPIQAMEIQSGGPQVFVAVIVSAEVARAELQAPGGTVVSRPEIVEGGGHRAVVAAATPDAAGGARDLVVFAADGRELARVDLEREGVSSGGSSGTATTVVGSAGD